MLPSKKGREIYFIYLPVKLMKTLDLSKGDVLLGRINKHDCSFTLKKGGSFQSEEELKDFRLKN